MKRLRNRTRKQTSDVFSYRIRLIHRPAERDRHTAEDHCVGRHLVEKIGLRPALLLFCGNIDGYRCIVLDAAKSQCLKMVDVVRVGKGVRTDLDKSDQKERCRQHPPNIFLSLQNSVKTPHRTNLQPYDQHERVSNGSLTRPCPIRCRADPRSHREVAVAQYGSRSIHKPSEGR